MKRCMGKREDKVKRGGSCLRWLLWKWPKQRLKSPEDQKPFYMWLDLSYPHYHVLKSDVRIIIWGTRNFLSCYVSFVWRPPAPFIVDDGYAGRNFFVERQHEDDDRDEERRTGWGGENEEKSQVNKNDLMKNDHRRRSHSQQRIQGRSCDEEKSWLYEKVTHGDGDGDAHDEKWS